MRVAISAAVIAAMPEEKVICIAGDASVLKNIQELGTISQYQLNVKIIIIYVKIIKYVD